MGENTMDIQDRITLERRISKTEENLVSMSDDIQDIKKGLRWIVGLIFSLNSTIIALLAQGFHLI